MLYKHFRTFNKAAFFFGPLRTTQQAIKHMKTQKKGALAFIRSQVMAT